MTLFDINLADNKRHDDDKLLTKTMINNYSKEGLLKPIKGKKYTKKSYFTNVTYLFTKKILFLSRKSKRFYNLSMIIWKKLNPFIIII